MAKPAMGFGRDKREGEDDEAIKRMFTPEFRNRLDAIIGFAGLSPEIVAQVVEKFLGELEGQLADQGVAIDLTPDARDKLAVDRKSTRLNSSHKPNSYAVFRL